MASVMCPLCNLTRKMRPFDETEFRSDSIREDCPRCKRSSIGGIHRLWGFKFLTSVAVDSLIAAYGLVSGDESATRDLQLGGRVVSFRQKIGRNVAYFIWDCVCSTDCVQFFCSFPFGI